MKPSMLHVVRLEQFLNISYVTIVLGAYEPEKSTVWRLEQFANIHSNPAVESPHSSITPERFLPERSNEVRLVQP